MSADDLSRASQAFEQRRRNRSHSGERTPEHLRLMAVALLGTYSSGRICKRLGLSGSNLYRWSHQQTGANVAEFVSLPEPVTESAPAMILSLAVSEQTQLTLQGDLSPAFVARLVEALRA